MYFFCFLHVPGANEKRDVWLDVCLGVNSDKISQTSALPMWIQVLTILFFSFVFLFCLWGKFWQNFSNVSISYVWIYKENQKHYILTFEILPHYLVVGWISVPALLPHLFFFQFFSFFPRVFTRSSAPLVRNLKTSTLIKMCACVCVCVCVRARACACSSFSPPPPKCVCVYFRGHGCMLTPQGQKVEPPPSPPSPPSPKKNTSTWSWTCT